MQEVLYQRWRWRHNGKYRAMQDIFEKKGSGEMTPQERMAALSRYLDMNFSQIAGSIGESVYKFYDVMRGKTNVSPRLARSLCGKYTELNYEWLMTGSGEMTSEPSSSGNSCGKDDRTRLIGQIDSLIKMNAALAETNRMLTQMLAEKTSENTIMNKATL